MNIDEALTALRALEADQTVYPHHVEAMRMLLTDYETTRNGLHDAYNQVQTITMQADGALRELSRVAALIEAISPVRRSAPRHAASSPPPARDAAIRSAPSAISEHDLDLSEGDPAFAL